MQNFLYIPAEGDKSAFWLNLSLVWKVSELPDGSLAIYGQSIPLNLTGKRAETLRAALSPAPKLPQLPKLDAAESFNARIERRGQLTGGISDDEYFDRHTEEVGA
jgi:hypothetical protein